MAKVKIDFRLDSAKFIEKMWKSSGSGAFRRETETILTEESKNFMGKGLSPVQGDGRFKKYKNPKKYPGKKGQTRGFPKRVTPVNLKLSGDLWKSFGRKDLKDGIEFGILNPKGNVEKYADVHNEGLRSDIAQRKFVPTRERETYAVSILRKLKNLFAKRVSELIRLGN